MPFDGLPALDKPSLAALSFALRHPETWPEGFVWDYGNCETCAMGLAYRLWGWIMKPEHFACDVAHQTSIAFGMRSETAGEIFLYARRVYGISTEEITPTHIADLIDAHLANSEP
jgi:hypothetical protein